MKVAAAVLAALTILRLAIAAAVPLVPDEAYYWVWSRALAPGYVDHPPMVALWIRAGTTLFGQDPFGVRVLGPLAAALETLMLADTAERLLPRRRAGLIAAALWNATLLIGAGSVIMTPDAPLLLFWCATLWAVARLATGGGGGWWLAAGVFAGLALVSKYTAALLWFGIALWVVAVPGNRRWLRGAAPWFGGMLGLAVFLPVALWNAEHQWVSFLKQGGRVGDWRPGRAAGFLGELIAGQIGLATPLVWLLCVAGLVVAVRHAWLGRASAVPSRGAGGFSAEPLLLALSLPAVAVFTQHAFGDRVQGNWPAIVYPAAVIAASGLEAPVWRRLLWPSVGLGFGLTAVVLLHAVTGILPVPPTLDPVARQSTGWTDLASQLEATRRNAGADYVVAEEYALFSELAWDAPATMHVVGIENRLVPMSLLRTNLKDQQGILIRSERRGGDMDPGIWSSVEPLGLIDRAGPRGTVERYRIWRVSGTSMATVLPRGRFADSE